MTLILPFAKSYQRDLFDVWWLAQVLCDVFDVFTGHLKSVFKSLLCDKQYLSTRKTHD
jgi:hypothetical protein